VHQGYNKFILQAQEEEHGVSKRALEGHRRIEKLEGFRKISGHNSARSVEERSRIS
jgi:hypothetical protein